MAKTSAVEAVQQFPRAKALTRTGLVFGDESGTQGGSRLSAFGTFWVASDTYENLKNRVAALKRKHRYDSEIKWTKVKRQTVDFYKDLISLVVGEPRSHFHAIIAAADKAADDNRDLQLRKQFGKLLCNKIEFFARNGVSLPFEVVIDPLPVAYAKADEAAHSIVNRQLVKHGWGERITKIETVDSAACLGVQIADILVGTVLAGWQSDEGRARHKADVIAHLAWCIGWPDLHADTLPSERHFNIWFHDPNYREGRKVQWRPVNVRV